MPRKGLFPRISILRHNCGIGMMVSLLGGDKPTKCAFYWKMRGGGKTYTGNMHYFTLFGFRIVIDTIKKKDLWTV